MVSILFSEICLLKSHLEIHHDGVSVTIDDIAVCLVPVGPAVGLHHQIPGINAKINGLKLV